MTFEINHFISPTALTENNQGGSWGEDGSGVISLLGQNQCQTGSFFLLMYYDLKKKRIAIRAVL